MYTNSDTDAAVTHFIIYIYIANKAIIFDNAFYLIILAVGNNAMQKYKMPACTQNDCTPNAMNNSQVTI